MASSNRNCSTPPSPDHADDYAGERKLACFWVPMEYPSARMSTRATAQLFLVVVLGIAFLATIAIGMYAAFVAPVETLSNVKVLVNTLLPAETALLGTAVAFYFRGGPRESGPRPPRGSP